MSEPLYDQQTCTLAERVELQTKALNRCQRELEETRIELAEAHTNYSRGTQREEHRKAINERDAARREILCLREFIKNVRRGAICSIESCDRALGVREGD